MLDLKNSEGYQIIYETSDGSEKYIYKNVIGFMFYVFCNYLQTLYILFTIIYFH